MSICGLFPPVIERENNGGKISLLVDGCYINNVPGKVDHCLKNLQLVTHFYINLENY